MAMRICYHQLTQSLSACSRTKTTLRLVFLTSAFEHMRARLCKSLRLFKLHHKQSVSQPRSVPRPHTRCMIHLHKAAKHYKNITDAQINTFKTCIYTYILHSTASQTYKYMQSVILDTLTAQKPTVTCRHTNTKTFITGRKKTHTHTIKMKTDMTHLIIETLTPYTCKHTHTHKVVLPYCDIDV